ncbi:MAG: hypothetical protein WC205_18885 [Opitutaceae bacterium]|jgi:hypothetical protein
MSAIKIHLEMAESDAVERYAASLHVKAEDVAYAALNRLMLNARDPEVEKDILETSKWRHDNLPLWSDSAVSIHAYEGKQDAQAEPSRYI